MRPRAARRALRFLRTLALGLACATACTTASATAQPFARPIGDQRLEALSAKYFDELWKLDPPRATRAGIHTYDDRLGSYDATAFATRLDFAKRTLHDLQAIDTQTMGADASYDERILEASLEGSILTLGSIAPWQHRPAYYTEVASGSAYALLARDFAPLADRVRALVAREHQMPALFDAARTNLTSVDATTGQIDRREILGSIDFFTTVVPQAVAPLKDASLRAQFAAVNGDAIASVKAYLAALDAGVFAHPSGTFAIGADRFAQLLALQELEPISLATYERVGENALAQTRAQFVETAKNIDPTQTPLQVIQALSAHHPAAAALLPKAASDLAALRSFVVRKDLITLPPDDDVKIVPTPEYARETTFASINVPGPLEAVTSAAFYNVTPADAAWSDQRQDQHLAFFNDAYFPLVSAHEVMPGHYVNFALARHEKLSLIRELLPSPSFSEGWAHYVEQMMVDSGWGNGNPHVRLAQLQGALQRECRYLVGLREHTQGMSIDDATKFFESNAFMTPETARREALRGTVDPLYGYYTLGKLELLKLRDDYRKAAGSSYKLKTFHDLLLSRGDPPIAIARKIVLGSEDDGKLL